MINLYVLGLFILAGGGQVMYRRPSNACGRKLVEVCESSTGSHVRGIGGRKLESSTGCHM